MFPQSTLQSIMFWTICYTQNSEVLPIAPSSSSQLSRLPIDNHSFFSNPMPVRFLKALNWLYPQGQDPGFPWDLNMVLTELVGPPLEPLATCSLLHLSMKTDFLITSTSARRLGELQALVSGLRIRSLARTGYSYALIRSFSVR